MTMVYWIVVACCDEAYKGAVKTVIYIFLMVRSLIFCVSTFLPPHARAMNARRIWPLLNWTTGTRWARCYLWQPILQTSNLVASIGEIKLEN